MRIGFEAENVVPAAGLSWRRRRSVAFDGAASVGSATGTTVTARVGMSADASVVVSSGAAAVGEVSAAVSDAGEGAGEASVSVFVSVSEEGRGLGSGTASSVGYSVGDATSGAAEAAAAVTAAASCAGCEGTAGLSCAACSAPAESASPWTVACTGTAGVSMRPLLESPTPPAAPTAAGTAAAAGEAAASTIVFLLVVTGGTVGQIFVSLENVIYCSQSVTVTSGTPAGFTTVEQIAVTRGAKRVWHPLSSMAMRALAPPPSASMGEGNGTGVVDWKTVEPPPGSLAVALIVMEVSSGRVGKRVKMPGEGSPGQMVAMGSWMVVVGKVGVVSLLVLVLAEEDMPMVGVGGGEPEGKVRMGLEAEGTVMVLATTGPACRTWMGASWWRWGRLKWKAVMGVVRVKMVVRPTRAIDERRAILVA